MAGADIAGDAPGEEAAGPLGPGRLILVVGPSGAGKDTLIAALRAHLAGDASYHFPRRVVTRPPSAAEDNEEADEARFRRMAEAGGFALAWQAHGHCYGVPAAIDDALRAGRTVICNVSRQVIAEARRRYGRVTVVEITAPAEVLRARIAARSRPTDGDAAVRADRRVPGATAADAVIVNDGTVAAAAERLLAVVAG